MESLPWFEGTEAEANVYEAYFAFLRLRDWNWLCFCSKDCFYLQYYSGIWESYWASLSHEKRSTILPFVKLPFAKLTSYYFAGSWLARTLGRVAADFAWLLISIVDPNFWLTPSWYRMEDGKFATGFCSSWSVRYSCGLPRIGLRFSVGEWVLWYMCENSDRNIKC